MIPINPEAVNLETTCITQHELSLILGTVIDNTVWVSQEFATLALLIGLGLGYWIGTNWERRKYRE